MDGRIYCTVERVSFSSIDGMDFDLYQRHFLMLASGESLRENGVDYHTRRAVTGESVYLTEPRNIEPASISVLILIHGAFMIVAWIGLTSIGIFLARHYKKTLNNHKTCGKDSWFIWHFICMVSTLLLTIAGVTVIFAEYGAWRTTVHAILGITVLALVVLQPIGAIFRPSPTSETRPVFKSLHFFFGNVIHLLAILSIFFAVPLAAAELPSWMSFVIVGYVVFYLLMHLLLNVSLLAVRS